MRNSVRYLLADAWRRGRAYFFFAAVFSFLLCVTVVAEHRLPIGGTALALCGWMTISWFLLSGIYPVLRSLPISSQTIGRLLWWCACGGFVLSTNGMLAVACILGYLNGEPAATFGEYARWMLIIAGVSGQGLAVFWMQAADSHSRLVQTNSWKTRVLQLLTRLSILLLAPLFLGQPPSATLIVVWAVAGYAIAIVSYQYAAYLALALAPRESMSKRSSESPDFHPPTLAVRTIRKVRTTTHDWLPVLFLIVFAISHLKYPEVTAVADKAPAFLASVFAVCVFVSGLFGVGNGIASLCALRVLPISCSRLSRILLVKAVKPLLMLGALALAANSLATLAPALSILAVVVHLAGLQTLWPGFAMSEISTVPAKRVAFVLLAFLWAFGGSIAILSGAHMFAWISGPLLGACGYIWAFRTVSTSSFAYRTLSSAHRGSRGLLAFFQLNR